MTDTIFEPDFEASPLQEALQAIGNNAWLVERMLLLPKHELWLKRDVQVARAAATTQIEGAALSESEVSDLLNTAQGPRLTPDQQANLNAVAAYDFVDYLSGQGDIPIDELVMRELNRQFLIGSSQALTPGSYRKGQNRVGDSYEPPDQGDVPALMRDFVTWLNTADEIDPVVRAALAHLHLVAIHPFWDGNGRTARAVATLVLQRSPRYAFRGLLSMEQYLAQTRNEYFSAIERSLGTGFSSTYNAMPFIEFFVAALRAHSDHLTQRLTQWHRDMEQVQAAAGAMNLNHRQADALAYAMKTGKLTRAGYLEITRTSPITASRDLADLVARGWLEPVGRTRGRFYRLLGPAQAPPAPPFSSRPPAT